MDSPHYHVWTDALYARALARAATNEWDLGSHVRWCVESGWTAFEMAAGEALNAAGLGNRFKDGIDERVAALNLHRIDWGQGTWQDAMSVYQQRKRYVHDVSSQDDLFPARTVAEDAIIKLRAAVKAVYTLAGKPSPSWVDEDVHIAPPADVAFITAYHDGLRPDDPNPDPDRIRIAYVYRDREHEAYVHGPGTDPLPLMDRLLRDTAVPISVVRAYRGDHVLHEWQVNMRGTHRKPTAAGYGRRPGPVQ